MAFFSFNGITKDYVRVLRGLERPTWAPIEYEILEIPGRPGGLIPGKKIKVRQINIPVRIYTKGFESLQKVKEDLAAWLITDEPKELIFSDEPDRVYYAQVTGEFNLDELVYWGEGVIPFICPDPYKYGLEKEAIFPSDVVSLNYNGTAPGDPVFELEVKEPVTFAAIQNQDEEYMMIGKPYDVTTQQPYEAEKRVFWNEMNNLTGWTTPGTVEGGTVSGSIKTNGYMFFPESYGTGSGWHGPALKTSIPEAPLHNFKIDALVEFWNTNVDGGKVGKLEIELLNSANEVVAKLSLYDSQFGSNVTVGQARAGKITGTYHFLIDEYGDSPGVWNNFYGLLRILRVGNYWEAYITKINQSTGRHHTSRWRSWTDTDGVISDEVTQVQIYMAQYENRSPIEMGVHDIKIWRLQREPEKIPYIAYPTDIITFDHKERLILLNGEPRKDLKDFGASYFTLKPGENQLIVMPENSFDVKCRYRERFK